MHGHLVAVKVGIVSGANEWMNSNGFAFDEQRFKRLDRQPMQGRGAVQQHGMSLRDLFQDVPNFRRLTLNHFFGAAHGVDVAEVLETTNDEWFEQNQRHLFRQTALVQFQFRPNNNDRAAGVIDALTEQVLTKTSTFTLEHITE